MPESNQNHQNNQNPTDSRPCTFMLDWVIGDPDDPDSPRGTLAAATIHPNRPGEKLLTEVQIDADAGRASAIGGLIAARAFEEGLTGIIHGDRDPYATELRIDLKDGER